MSEPSGLSRRELLKNTGRVAAAGALLGVDIPKVHAAEDNTIQLALVGCGGRGTGAAGDAMNTKLGPVKLVAMADVFDDKRASCVIAVEEVPQEDTIHYGIVQPEAGADDVFRVLPV